MPKAKQKKKRMKKKERLLHADHAINKILNLYLDNGLTQKQRSEIDFRLKVEPRLADYLRNLRAVRNLEKLRREIPASALAAPSPRYNLWILDEQENAFLKTAVFVRNSWKVMRAVDTWPQAGQTSFARHTAGAIERVLYVPETWTDAQRMQIIVVHYGNVPGDAMLEVEDASGSAEEHEIKPNDALQVVVRKGKINLRTKKTAIPKTTLLLT